MTIPLEQARRMIHSLNDKHILHLFAQANAKHVLYEVNETPKNFPAFDADLEDKVTFTAYALLAASCSKLEHNEEDGIVGLEKAVTLLQNTYSPFVETSHQCGFHILISAMAYYAAGHYSRAFVSLRKIEGLTKTSKIIASFIQKDFNGVIPSLNAVLLQETPDFESQQALDEWAISKSIESLKRIMREIIIKSKSFCTSFNGEIINESNSSPTYPIEIRDGKLLSEQVKPLLIEQDPEFKLLLNDKKAPENQADYLLKQKIINLEESEFLKKIFKEERNQIAHLLMKILIDDSVPSLNMGVVKKIALIAHKIGNYKMKYIDPPMDMETWEEVPFDSIDENAASMETLFLHNIIDICERNFEKFKTKENS